MKPYYENEHGQLYHGDCLEILPKLIEQGVKVDAVITDPPYICTITGGGHISKSWKSSKKFFNMIENFEDHLAQFKNILRNNTHCLIFCNAKSMQNMLNQSIKHFKFIDILTVIKTNCYPIGGYYLRKTEFIILLTKGFRRINDESQINIFFAEPVQNLYHPTTKPINVLKKLILNSTNKNNLILDPFAGSGTTLLAAQALGRRWIGIEIEKEYCDICIKRLEGTIEQIPGQVRMEI